MSSQSRQNDPASSAADELLPEHDSSYAPPRPVPAVSDHKTMEMETIKLSPEIDPRRAVTQRSLRRPAPPEGAAAAGRQRVALLVLGLVAVALVGGVLLVSAVRGGPAEGAAAPSQPEPVAPGPAEPASRQAELGPRVAGPTPGKADRERSDELLRVPPPARQPEPSTTAPPSKPAAPARTVQGSGRPAAGSAPPTAPSPQPIY